MENRSAKQENRTLSTLVVAVYQTQYNGSESDIISALLHGVLEDSKYSFKDIHKNFGLVVAQLVDCVSKKKIWKTSYAKMKSNLDEMESFDLINPKVAMKSVRLKILDRLHNIRTIYGLPLEKQKKKNRGNKRVADTFI